MTTSVEPPPPRLERRRPGLGTVLAVAITLVIVVMWAVVFIWAAVHKPVDRLQDQAYAKRAQQICAATVGQMDKLPAPTPTQSNVDRAAVVVQSDVLLRDMLDQLEAIAPRTGNDATVVREWLADYRTYVGNRENYAQRLRTDPKAQFYESEKDGSQITIPVDTLATANGMNACVAPADLS